VQAQDLGLRLERGSALLSAISTARRHVRISAYSLWPQQLATRELVVDARRGVRVSVTLSGSAFGAARRANATVLRELKAAGVHARISRFQTHLKAAIIDGVVYLSDVNFAEHGLVVQDGVPADRALIVEAMNGTAGADNHLWTQKAAAIAAEDRVARVRATHDLDVESESFSENTGLYGTLGQRAKAGDRVRLLVAAREAAGAREQVALRRLELDGVAVRLGDRDEKLAVDGPDCFFGSANASAGVPDQIEWGIAVRSTALAGAVQARFNREWRQGRRFN